MHLALLTGGISAERPISLRSRDGLLSFIAETHHTCDVFDLPSQIDDFLTKYQQYDLITPYIHGRYGEDGILAGLCETLQIAYAGCPSGTHALCIDKFRTNCVVSEIERSAHESWQIKIPKTWLPGVTSHESVNITRDDISYPLIVKPNTGGSSTATSKVHTYADLLEAIEKVKDIADVPLVQECIEGEEYTVGVVGPTYSPEVLPIMQIVSLKSELFDWQEKYESDGTNEIFAEHISADLKNRLEAASQRIYSSLGCRGVARIDYRVRGDEIFFLEVNTYPGATQASFIPKMWRKTGRSMGEFIEMLIQNSTHKSKKL